MEGLAGTAADGVDQDVDAAEPLDRLLDHPLAVGLVGRVGDDGQALAARRLDLVDGGVEGSLRAADDDDPGAGPGEGHRQRRADAAATARDDGDEAVEPEVVERAHRPPRV